MNEIDIIIILPLLWGAYKGAKNGLIKELANLLVLLMGLYFALSLSERVSAYLKEEWGWETAYLPVISFILIFIAVAMGVMFISRALDKVIKGLALSWLNYVGGVLFGILKFGLIVSILLTMITGFEKDIEIIPQKKKDESLLYKPTLKWAQVLIPALQDAEVIKENKGFFEEKLDELKEKTDGSDDREERSGSREL